jgi:hypothetical protein
MPTKLLKGRYFLVTEDEAKATRGSQYKDHWSQARGVYVLGFVTYTVNRSMDTRNLTANDHTDSTSSILFTV